MSIVAVVGAAEDSFGGSSMEVVDVGRACCYYCSSNNSYKLSDQVKKDSFLSIQSIPSKLDQTGDIFPLMTAASSPYSSTRV